VDLIKAALQLDELRLAIRSPVGRAEEHKDNALRSHQGLERADLPALVRETEPWNPAPDLRAQFLNIDTGRRLNLWLNLRSRIADCKKYRCRQQEHVAFEGDCQPGHTTRRLHADIKARATNWLTLLFSTRSQCPICRASAGSGA
jgi:hypothetical protein